MNTEKLIKFAAQNREHFHLPEKVEYGYSDIGYYLNTEDQGPEVGDQFELQIKYTKDFYTLLVMSGTPYWKPTEVQITSKLLPHKVEAVIFWHQEWLEGRKVLLERDDKLRTWVLTGMSEGPEYSQEVLGAMKTVRRANLKKQERDEKRERENRKIERETKWKKIQRFYNEPMPLQDVVFWAFVIFIVLLILGH